MITGRSKIVIIDRCYHGSVDETFATLDGNGKVVSREGNIGAPVDLAQTTRVVEFNDLRGMEAALKRELKSYFISKHNIRIRLSSAVFRHQLNLSLQTETLLPS